MRPAWTQRHVRRHRAVGAGVASLALIGALTGAVTHPDPPPPALVAAPQPQPQPRPALPVPAVDTSARDVPVADRSAYRTNGPRQVPKPTSKDASCRLDLGYGVWEIDLAAARTLTMLTAVAYRDGRKLAKAARAFERSLGHEGRTGLSPERAEHRIKLKRKKTVPRATSMDAVLALFRPHTLFCAQPMRTVRAEPMLTNGLTARAQSMVFGFFEAYGGAPLGGFDPEGISSGHIEDSAHYDGRAVDAFFRLDDPDNKARGWLLAHWLVAHGDYHQIETVIFDDHIWSRTRSPEGWRKYTHPYGKTDNVTLRHLDHIHVDVVHGWPEDDDEDGAETGDAAQQGREDAGAENRPASGAAAGAGAPAQGDGPTRDGATPEKAPAAPRAGSPAKPPAERAPQPRPGKADPLKETLFGPDPKPPPSR